MTSDTTQRLNGTWQPIAAEWGRFRCGNRNVSQWLVTLMFMTQEQMPTLLGNRQSRSAPAGHTPKRAASSNATRRVRAALRELRRARVGSLCRDEAVGLAAVLGEVRSVADSLLCDVAVQVDKADLGSGADSGEVLRQDARLPSRESKKMAKVARQLGDMPKVKERFAAGQITVDHAKALAAAAEKVGAEVVEADDRLLGAAGEMLPDRFGRLARDWSNQKLIEAGVDPMERQRRAREAKLWVEKDTGLGVLWAKLARPEFEQVRQAIDRHYHHHLRQDRADGQDPDRVRDPNQRRADVVFELLTNRDADTGEPLEGTVGVKAKAATQLIVVAPIGAVDGTDPDGTCEIVGVGPVPRRILSTLSPDTQVAGMVFDRAGRPLWLGRRQRLANTAQRLAVAVRDGGCFACDAPMHQCELHHIREWHRDRGRTDVDNLVAACPRHHKWLETNNLEVTPTPTGYQTQPRASPNPP